MSTPINDGGPAFPISEHGLQGYNGMSLRDWFAGLAMQAIIAKHPAEVVAGSMNEIDAPTAKGAYEYADAMIAERKEAE